MTTRTAPSATAAASTVTTVRTALLELRTIGALKAACHAVECDCDAGPLGTVDTKCGRSMRLALTAWLDGPTVEEPAPAPTTVKAPSSNADPALVLKAQSALSVCNRAALASAVDAIGLPLDTKCIPSMVKGLKAWLEGKAPAGPKVGSAAAATQHAAPAVQPNRPLPTEQSATSAPIAPAPVPTIAPTVSNPVANGSGTVRCFVQGQTTAGTHYAPANGPQCMAWAISLCQSQSDVDAMLDVVCELAATRSATLAATLSPQTLQTLGNKAPVEPVKVAPVQAPVAKPAPKASEPAPVQASKASPAPVATTEPEYPAPVAKPETVKVRGWDVPVVIPADKAMAAWGMPKLVALCQYHGVIAVSGDVKATVANLATKRDGAQSPMASAAQTVSSTTPKPVVKPVAPKASKPAAAPVSNASPTEAALLIVALTYKQAMKLGKAELPTLARKLGIEPAGLGFTKLASTVSARTVELAGKPYPGTTNVVLTDTEPTVKGLFVSDGKGGYRPATEKEVFAAYVAHQGK